MHVAISLVVIKKYSKKRYNFEGKSRQKWNNIHWVNPNRKIKNEEYKKKKKKNEEDKAGATNKISQ